MSHPKPSPLAEVEYAHALHGHLKPIRESGEVRVYLARWAEQSPEKSLALAEVENTPGLERIRAALSAGRIEIARQELSRPTGNSPMSEVDASEHELESIRLRFFEGDWVAVLEDSAKLLEAPSLLVTSRLVLHQLRAHAAFEGGQLELSRAELDRLSLLGRLAPHAPCLLYAAITQALLEIESDPSNAHAGLERVASVARRIERNPTRDSLQAYFRLRSRAERRLGLDPSNAIVSAYLLAREQGDSFFADLALAEWISGESAHERATTWAQECLRLEALAASNARLARALSSESSHSERNPQARAILLSLRSDSDPRLVVYWSRERWLKETTEPVARVAPLTEALHAALERIGNVSLPAPTDEDLFQTQHPALRFHARVHAPGVRSLLVRLRRQTGLPIQTRAGRMQVAPGGLVL